MATTANNLSPKLSSADDLGSPKSHRASAAAKSASPAWTQIVRGGGGGLEAVAGVSLALTAADAAGLEPLVVPAASDCLPVKASSHASSSLDEPAAVTVAEGLDSGNGGNAGKKPVWKKPSNGDVEVGSFMGADSWPALSESAKTSSKSSSDSQKAHSDGSISVSQGTEVAPPTHKQASNNKNHNSSQNHALPNRQKSMKRYGGNALANGGLPQSPNLHVESASSNSHTNTHKNSNWDGGHRVGSGSHSHGGHDHPHPRNSGRRGNGGPYPRGDGSYSHNHAGRRDQDRANRDWNPQRRDGHMQPPGVPRGLMRPVPPPPPPNAAPFISPQPMRPFVSYPGPEFPMYYFPVPPPYVASIPPHAVFFAAQDPQLHTRILNQIDYYFSETNLIKDEFLRRHMDEQGWVSIRLIAGFKKIMEMTDNIQLILGAIQTSTVVEVQVDKVRKRDDWWKFLLPSGPQSFAKSGQDTLTDRVRNITLEERTNNYSSTNAQADVHAEAFLSRSSSGDSNSHFHLSSGARSPQVNIQAGSDCSVSAKNTS